MRWQDETIQVLAGYRHATKAYNTFATAGIINSDIDAIQVA